MFWQVVIAGLHCIIAAYRSSSGNGRGDGKWASACVCVCVDMFVLCIKPNDRQPEQTHTHTHRKSRESLRLLLDWARGLNVISVTMRPVVTEPHDQKPFHSLLSISQTTKPHIWWTDVYLSSTSCFLYLSLLLFPLGRPGVNPTLLHLVQTTHTSGGAAAAHQQRACVCVFMSECVAVCITQRHADKRRTVLAFTQKQ